MIEEDSTGSRFTPKLDFNAEFSLSSQISTRNMVAAGSSTVPATSPINPFTTAVSVTFPWNGEAPVWSDTVSRRITTGLAYKLPYEWKALFDYTWNQTANAYYSTAGG